MATAYKNGRVAAVKDTVFRNGLAQHGDVQSINDADGTLKVMRNNGEVETWKAAEVLHKEDVGKPAEAKATETEPMNPIPQPGR